MSLKMIGNTRLVKAPKCARYQSYRIMHLDMKFIPSFWNKIPKRAIFWGKTIRKEKNCLEKFAFARSIWTYENIARSKRQEKSSDDL